MLQSSEILDGVCVVTSCFKITIKALSGDSFQDTTIYWTVTVPQGAANPGTVTASPATMTPLTVALLSAKLKQVGQYTFTLSSVAQADYNFALLNYTSDFIMAGK